MPVEPLSDAEVEHLDLGIRELVVKLRDAGYETTDSGDGVSKPKDWYESGEAMPFPHVAVRIPAPKFMWLFANELRDWLEMNGHATFTVEASYVPGHSAIALVRPVQWPL